MTTARDRPPEEAAEDTSFARGLRLLLTIADRGDVRADELGASLDMPLSTVYRYLRTLIDFGFVDRNGGQFRLGPRLLIGPGANVTSQDLIRVADPPLRTLVDETGETAVVVRRVGLSNVCLHQVECAAALRVALQPGGMTPLHVGALGRTLLAFAPAEILTEVVAQDLPGILGTFQTEAAFRASLDEIVAKGTASSEGELVAGTVMLATPIFREDGIVGAIGLLGPGFRCDSGWQNWALGRLEGAARTINAALGSDASR